MDVEKLIDRGCAKTQNFVPLYEKCIQWRRCHRLVADKL